MKPPQRTGRTWNVLAPVVALISAGSADEAITALRARLSAAGFDVYDGEPGCHAFESEDLSGAFRCHYCNESLILTGNGNYAAISTGRAACAQSPDQAGHQP